MGLEIWAQVIIPPKQGHLLWAISAALFSVSFFKTKNHWSGQFHRTPVATEHFHSRSAFLRNNTNPCPISPLTCFPQCGLWSPSDLHPLGPTGTADTSSNRVERWRWRPPHPPSPGTELRVFHHWGQNEHKSLGTRAVEKLAIQTHLLPIFRKFNFNMWTFETIFFPFGAGCEWVGCFWFRLSSLSVGSTATTDIADVETPQSGSLRVIMQNGVKGPGPTLHIQLLHHQVWLSFLS